MTCGEFLARHSDYLDEELGADGAAEMRQHMGGCARCARYDRVLRRGLELVRDLEPVLPTTDGYVALHEHLARTTPPPPETAAPRAPLAATIAVAGVVALVAWSALFRATGVPAMAAGESVFRGSDGASELVAGTGAELMAVTSPVLPGIDVVTPLLPAARPGWRRSPATLAPASARVRLPGPYTPLVLQPPDFGDRPAVPPPSPR